jgi:hypothetical protein
VKNRDREERRKTERIREGEDAGIITSARRRRRKTGAPPSSPPQITADDNKNAPSP